ncbi:hypothetical protein HMPREF7215_0635 [Pyramidobacter piscolens W5455]|uniref:Uncharacterized protein n=1 Tax=Pyramidobacter piscolens W5455 TaxID=352165 RepID=A0ABM9ZVZ8_9BACT|nr:hypothetical protein HMPREF7215_0635 [Pyramidobacter piscolens W5455]
MVLLAPTGYAAMRYRFCFFDNVAPPWALQSGPARFHRPASLLRTARGVPRASAAGAYERRDHWTTTT